MKVVTNCFQFNLKLIFHFNKHPVIKLHEKGGNQALLQRINTKPLWPRGATIGKTGKTSVSPRFGGYIGKTFS